MNALEYSPKAAFVKRHLGDYCRQKKHLIIETVILNQ